MQKNFFSDQKFRGLFYQTLVVGLFALGIYFVVTNTAYNLGIVSSSTQLESEISGAFDSGFNFTGTIGKAVGVWSAGGALINAQKEHTGTGLRNAALQFGGASPLGQCTEEYNGTAWSAGGAKITAANYLGSAGSLTSALSIGGSPDTDETEKYDGTAWSETGNLNTGRYMLGSTGTQNAALISGGRSGPTKYKCTEQYDGSIWSEVGTLSTTAYTLAIAGTQNAALAGAGTGNSSEIYKYDGTAWSETADIITGRPQYQGAGEQNAAYIFGAYTTDLDDTEAFNGMSWSECANLITGRGVGASGGTANSAILAGGLSPGSTKSCTEHWDGTTWSAGGAINHARWAVSGAGNETAMVIFGDDGYQNCTEEYNGTTWSAVVGLIKGRDKMGSLAAGNQSAALAASGFSPSPALNSVTCTEEYSATYVKTVCLNSQGKL